MLLPMTGTSLDPALPGSIMRREGSNISRCKPCFSNCTPKQGLHLEIFDPPEIADGFWCSPLITEMDYGGEYIKYYNNLLVSVSIIQSFRICILDIES